MPLTACQIQTYAQYAEYAKTYMMAMCIRIHHDIALLSSALRISILKMLIISINYRLGGLTLSISTSHTDSEKRYQNVRSLTVWTLLNGARPFPLYR